MDFYVHIGSFPVHVVRCDSTWQVSILGTNLMLQESLIIANCNGLKMMGFRLFDFYHTLCLLVIFVHVQDIFMVAGLLCARSQVTVGMIRAFLGCRNLLRNSFHIMHFYLTQKFFLQDCISGIAKYYIEH
jgi:hypothetical protein